MNIAMILAAGVGQRMRSGGLPKQFLKLFGKPIIVYTLEKFQQHPDIDRIVVVCREGYTDYMSRILHEYDLTKVCRVAVGGSSRQASLGRGLEAIRQVGGEAGDIAVIHDGVRPMVSATTIRENIRVAREHGCAITVHPVSETVVITEGESATIRDFKKRRSTYSLTAPQTFQLGDLLAAYDAGAGPEYEGMPLLDAGMLYASRGGDVRLVKEQGMNIKITTPEDFYYLKAMIELEENKSVFGI